MVSHDGKSPGKFWYALQRTRGVIAAAADPKNRGELTQIGVLSGLAVVGTLGVGAFALSNPFAALGLWMVLTPAGIGGVISGFVVKSKIQEFCKGPSVQSFIRKRESKWLERQKNPISKRVAGFAKKAALHAGKVGGFVAAGAGLVLGVAGGLAMANVGTVAGNALLGGVFAKMSAAAAGVGLAVAGPAVAVYVAVGVMLGGAVTGMLCRKKLNSSSPQKEKKSVARASSPRIEASSPVASSATSEFNAARAAAAAARAAARAKNKNTPRFG